MKTFFIVWRWSNTGLCCTKRLWSLHPWGYSKLDWTTSWTTSSRWPCLSREWDQMISKRSLPTKPFCDCVCYMPKDQWRAKTIQYGFWMTWVLAFLKSSLGSKGKTLSRSLLFLNEACVVPQKESKMAFGNPSLLLTKYRGICSSATN